MRAASYLISDGGGEKGGKRAVVRRLIRARSCARGGGSRRRRGNGGVPRAIAAIAIEMGDACDPERKAPRAKVFDVPSARS